jgi:hypothetical protein
MQHFRQAAVKTLQLGMYMYGVGIAKPQSGVLVRYLTWGSSHLDNS